MYYDAPPPDPVARCPLCGEFGPYGVMLPLEDAVTPKYDVRRVHGECLMSAVGGRAP
jgi:hypothetical protein